MNLTDPALKDYFSFEQATIRANAATKTFGIYITARKSKRGGWLISDLYSTNKLKEIIK